MVIAHSTGMLTAIGAGGSASLAPVVYNVGYIIGCLTGGKLVEVVGGRPALSLVNAVLLLALIPLATGAPLSVALLSLALVGATLGGAASLTPMLVARLYGVERVGAIYGKLNIAYGLGGLLAPWIAGVLYVRTGNYAAAIYLAIAVAAMGVAASLTIRSGRRGGPGRKLPGNPGMDRGEDQTGWERGTAQCESCSQMRARGEAGNMNGFAISH